MTLFTAFCCAACLPGVSGEEQLLMFRWTRRHGRKLRSCLWWEGSGRRCVQPSCQSSRLITLCRVKFSSHVCVSVLECLVVMNDRIWCLKFFPTNCFPNFSLAVQLLSRVWLFVIPWTPGFPVDHQLPEFTQSHAEWVGDAIQPSHPLSSPSPPVLNLSQHQGLFKWVNSSHKVAKVLKFQLQHQSFQRTSRTDLF